MLSPEVYPRKTEFNANEIAPVFEYPVWQDTAPAERVRNEIVYSPRLQLIRTARSHLQTIVPQIEAGVIKPSETLPNNTGLLLDDYLVGDVLGFSVEYLDTTRSVRLLEGPRRPGLDMLAKHRVLDRPVITIMSDQPVGSNGNGPLTYQFEKRIQSADKTTLERSVYAFHRWYGVVLETEGHKSLYGLPQLTGRPALQFLRFPKHQPAKINYPTASKKIGNDGLNELIEYIWNVDVYSQPDLWQELYDNSSWTNAGRLAVRNICHKIKNA